MHCWQAGRAQLAAQAAAALLAGVAPVATAWLLRALLDDLATGHPQRVVGLAIALGVLPQTLVLNWMEPSVTGQVEALARQGP